LAGQKINYPDRLIDHFNSEARSQPDRENKFLNFGIFFDLQKRTTNSPRFTSNPPRFTSQKNTTFPTTPLKNANKTEQNRPGKKSPN
jgi:hypothetical protein